MEECLINAEGAYGLYNIINPPSHKKHKENNVVSGYHVHDTTPFYRKYPGCMLEVEDFELLTAILSALMWRKFNGTITLITDNAGAAFYKEKGLDCIWDNIENTLDCWAEGINSTRYWASGKILALEKIEVPFAIVDMDLIIWGNIYEKLHGASIVATHEEKIIDYVYPDKNFFTMKEPYAFEEEWDWTIPAANTAFFYLADNELKEYYIEESLAFMRNCRTIADNGFRCMVFAEQRILAMCAKKMGISIDYLLEQDKLDESQNMYTHVWNAKAQLRANQELKDYYCRCCLNIINKTFPEYINIIKAAVNISEKG